MTRAEVKKALAKCSRAELEIMVHCTPHEVELMLEAKLYADATISSPPREGYNVLRSRHNG